MYCLFEGICGKEKCIIVGKILFVLCLEIVIGCKILGIKENKFR